MLILDIKIYLIFINDSIIFVVFRALLLLAQNVKFKKTF